MYTAIQSAIAVDFTLYKIKLLLLIIITMYIDVTGCIIRIVLKSGLAHLNTNA